MSESTTWLAEESVMVDARQPSDRLAHPSRAQRPRGIGRAVRTRWCVLASAVVVSLLAVPAAVATGDSAPTTQAGRPTAHVLPDGRRLNPSGNQVGLGNFPTGAALTADGKFLWTVSAGFGNNDVRIVDTREKQVCQVITLPGASGGIALDSPHRLAYVSGLPNSRWQPSKNNLAGARGNDVLVYRWTATCGQAQLVRVIPVPPPPFAPTVQAFPPIAPGARGSANSWPQKLAVSPDGTQLLVALNLADAAAVIDLSSDVVRYVPTGSYPYGAAILPDGHTGLVTNEASGSLSVVDLENAVKLADVTVGPPLSHPLGVVVDAAGRRAYVAISASDEVAVVNIRHRRVVRTISVGRRQGLGTMPVALALGRHGSRLFVAESGADEIAVIRLPGPSTRHLLNWTVLGRIPTADQPQAVATLASHGKRPAQLAWVSAEAVGVGPNPTGPDPKLASDPIFAAFDPVPPVTDIFSAGVTFLPDLVRGRAGLMTMPSDKRVRQITPAASRQLQPVDAQPPPARTPLRAGGPIKHVFFVVRENRSYDQMLGDIGRGNSDAHLTVFGKRVTPNLHALVTRFPLMDNVLANSEASIQGHYWTSAASVPDYVTRNWVQNYSGRGRPADFGMYAVTWPGNGFLFNRAQRQNISYFNYGEGLDGGSPTVPDRSRSAAQLRKVNRVDAKSDLGPGLTPGGCYPSDLSIGLALDKGEIFDSSLPAGAPAGSYSHVDCFRKRFAAQLSTGTVPALSYLSLTSDHTRGTALGFPTPAAMVADSDRAVGELVDTISHSSIWASSAIFVVEDDSQDGADHADAHRIPAMVISPYARAGVVVHNRYDLLSVVRSMELILGMRPLSLNDAMATPMYAAFAAKPVNAAPVHLLPSNINLLSRNQPGAPLAHLSSRLMLGEVDQAPQDKLDAILWQSVYGADSTPPPPGPNAELGE